MLALQVLGARFPEGAAQPDHEVGPRRVGARLAGLELRRQRVAAGAIRCDQEQLAQQPVGAAARRGDLGERVTAHRPSVAGYSGLPSAPAR